VLSNALISMYNNCGAASKGLALYESMIASNRIPDVTTYIYALQQIPTSL